MSKQPEPAKHEAVIAFDMDERAIPQLEAKIRLLDESIELQQADKLKCEDELARLKASRAEMMPSLGSSDGEMLPDPPRRGPGRPRRS